MSRAGAPPRLLLPQSRGAKTLEALLRLSAPLPPNQFVSSAQLQAELPDDDSLRAAIPSLFKTRVLDSLLNQALVHQPRPGQWRLTGEGLHMLKRLAESVALQAAHPGKKLNSGKKAKAIAAALAPASGKKPKGSSATGPITPGRLISNLVGTYDKDEGNFNHIRPGALDFRELPSRRGNMLVYRDGRQEPITHGAAPAQRPRPSQADLQPATHQVAPAGTAAANDATRKARA